MPNFIKIGHIAILRTNLPIKELKVVFFSLKINKSLGYRKINFNVVKKCFIELYDPLKFVLELSLEKVIFPDDLKTARVIAVFKGGDRSKFGNCRSISVLPSFSKIHEHIMYNRFYKHLLENKILYLKQFGFQSLPQTIWFSSWLFN